MNVFYIKNQVQITRAYVVYVTTMYYYL